MNLPKLVQKDQDARWIVKYSKSKGSENLVDIAIPFFGYKNHIPTDKRYGFIRKYQITDAGCYDGKVLKEILDKANTTRFIWGDTAYRSAENEKFLLIRVFFLSFSTQFTDDKSVRKIAVSIIALKYTLE